MNRKTRMAVIGRDGLACAYCGRVTEPGKTLGPSGTVIEHSFGYSIQDEQYLVVSCRSCNSKKNRMTVVEWLQQTNEKIEEIKSLERLRDNLVSVIARTASKSRGRV